MYNLEKQFLIKKIKKSKPKRILLQLPNGLKKYALELAGFIENNSNTKVIVSGEHCYGSCDLALNEAQNLKADLIVHYGHSEFVKTKFPVIYLKAESSIKINKKDLLKKLKNYKKIGICASIQYLHQLKDLKKFLEANKKKVFLTKKTNKTSEGQILGCNYQGLKKIDPNCFLILSSKFHALGAALTINKKIFFIDQTGINDIEKLKNTIIKKRAILIDKARSAKNFSIILGLKPGQQDLILAEKLKEKLIRKNKKVILTTMDDITNDKLLNFYNIDIFINTACPRLTLDNTFGKPVITSKEALVVLNELTWKNLLEKGFL